MKEDQALTQGKIHRKIRLNLANQNQFCNASAATEDLQKWVSIVGFEMEPWTKTYGKVSEESADEANPWVERGERRRGTWDGEQRQ